MKPKTILYTLATVLLVAGLAAALAGCYSASKAKGQFGKAVTAYPKIGADYCAITYPAPTGVIPGDTVTVIDTLWGQLPPDTVTIIYTDTVTNVATAIKTIRIKADTIRIRSVIRDTVFTGGAELRSCAITRDEAVALAKQQTLRADQWESKAKKRFGYLVGAGALIALLLFFIIRRKKK